MALQVRAFDLVEDEVRVLLNGRLVAVLSPTPKEGWGPAEALLLPDVRMGENRLTFDSRPNPYRKDPWGIRILGAGEAGLV
jgi:hypothetical protein